MLFKEFACGIHEKPHPRLSQHAALVGAISGLEHGVIALEESVFGNITVSLYAFEEDVHEWHRRIFEIRAGTSDAGHWAYGSGNLMEENIWFSVKNEHPLGSATALMAKMLTRASELALSVAIEKTGFWECDRNPEGDYSKP